MNMLNRLALTIACMMPLPAAAANVYMYVGPTGQTLYGRVEETDGNFVAFALTEGTGGAKGKYYATEANIVAAGLDTAGTFLLTVHYGATPSTTAEDPIVAFDDAFGWSGATYRNPEQVLLATTNGAATVATQLARLDAAVTSVATPADTRDLDPVQFTWQLSRRTDGTLVSTNTLRIAPGETVRTALDCNRQIVLPSGSVLATMATPTSTYAKVTPTKLGIDATNAKAEVVAAADAVVGTTAYVRTTVTNSYGGGPVVLLGKVEVVDDTP